MRRARERVRERARERCLSPHAQKEAGSQQEGGCLSARKRALTSTCHASMLILDFQPPELMF